MIQFNNGSSIQAIPSINSLRSERHKLMQISYHCPICGINHIRFIKDLYYIKGEWYCKECVDKMTKEDKGRY